MILIKDEEFIRGNCPMTKEDIRALSIFKLELKDDSKVLDIGSGTGSITVQASKISYNGQIYSIEKDEEAIEVTKKNIEKFKCENIELFKGEALDILDTLKKQNKKFDSIFIGGSSGSLEKIILDCNELIKDCGNIVMNFITIDNAYKAIDLMRSLNYKIDISMVNISKNRGDSYMMIANNPIYIVKAIRREI
ncbi:precorrin-6Y C5,15-methyltransferase (decarboxylating) subunit CbiT [Clostridium chauvoei]|uniref:Precorrin-6Y C5,15-methyltransferase (Decarboxylating) subunit CbiT n=2 Tax=Clostridium chauvoei TaxID=46867 RepID=A0ABD4RJE1_9CLOT|nr:precorrin-6Y C5,15-methyltransferase (decarboxylating) subunit CbiT [Clostridium chauvoei]ATD54832.1 precorrin-6Y C5,15-methyltransferase (decarboxylating) subunit CbiT [Clostridium chauvoei]ATD57488.1 precorrin-6Y C5,15-methyltransferase (decarboxylating) subunit CbiT [Clostridium chauvoei]MBX7281164.1 precorrin-6Y C5,15-methyltransferase (decarboxylating) subunit CbiT [Clostridium chauvoei]MBX7283660.1 precorrin-6Y C5,15-methyltransferase (decarboxylating) subunit CbiT [Clostridium chauvoe